jgi:hypothetical protein
VKSCSTSTISWSCVKVAASHAKGCRSPMTELSQAERLAMETACRHVDLQHRAVRYGWVTGRDYGRERERALETALEKLIMLPCGAGSGERSMKTTVERIATEALASPGEPEGQCSWCDGKRVLMEPDGSKHQPCPHCQPDHGPGEPSGADQLREAIRLCLDERATELAVDPSDMPQRYVAQEYGRKLERIFARLGAALQAGESNG